jgi:hypothetical protein
MVTPPQMDPCLYRWAECWASFIIYAAASAHVITSHHPQVAFARTERRFWNRIARNFPRKCGAAFQKKEKCSSEHEWSNFT